MSDRNAEYTWQTLPNPFLRITHPSEVITGHVSGRKSDITFIITGAQSAIIMMGPPRIGKSTLIRYLQRPPDAGWSWRDELTAVPHEQLDAIHFASVDLTPLAESKHLNELMNPFIAQCAVALGTMYTSQEQTFSTDLKGVRKLLSMAQQENATARYFLIFDTIDRLGKAEKEVSGLERVWVQQEQGLKLLDHCNAIHTLVELIDDFSNFGVIFSLQSFPRPTISDQFTHVSADLARFTNMILQGFTWEDTENFLAQPPTNFGADWANTFKNMGGTYIFSQTEQEWIQEQTGTHPYLLQQFCLYTFRLKQDYAELHGTWPDLDEIDQIDEGTRQRLTERMNERLNTFFDRLWKRLQEALGQSNQGTRELFSTFVKSLASRKASDLITSESWDQLGPEIRYILYSEGIVRYNQLQPIHFPGALLRDYLVQKVRETNGHPSFLASFAPPPARGYWLRITQPGKAEERISVTDLEYRLLKTLMEHAGHCTETVLMLGGWQKPVDRSTFTQRMHHLRKKLKDRSGGEEIIGNRYGGLYWLNHPDWFHLE